MPIKYDIIENKQLVQATGVGVVTTIDIIKHLDTLAADNRYIAPMKKLVDYRLIDDIEITSEEAREIADKKMSLINTFRGERCAFVSPDDTSYGSSRVHKALSEGTNASTEVFRRLEGALDWLNITLDMNPE